MPACPVEDTAAGVKGTAWPGRLVWSIWPYRLVRACLAAVFIVAGASKLLQPAAFAKAIGDFGIVYPPLLMATAIGLALVELAAGIGLLLDRKGSLPVISGLLVLFLLVLSYGLWLGLDIDCGCLAVELPWGWDNELSEAVWRDIVLLALCGYLYAWKRVHSRAANGCLSEDRGVV